MLNKGGGGHYKWNCQNLKEIPFANPLIFVLLRYALDKVYGLTI